MKRNIITIDKAKCTGCGLCVNGCPEGAIQLIDGKAQLVREDYCDGLGACIGDCPEDAITIEEREVPSYDERAVINYIIPQGDDIIAVHLHHLKEHDQLGDLAIALDVLTEKHIKLPEGFSLPAPEKTAPPSGGCPGMRMMQFENNETPVPLSGEVPSQLQQWPIQLHLVSPDAPYYHKADLLLAADCTAFSFGNFHADFLAGKALVIACPKLDTQQDVYTDKLIGMIDSNLINTLTVLIMEVPCCAGLLRLAQTAVDKAQRTVPVKCITVGIKGSILSEKWL